MSWRWGRWSVEHPLPLGASHVIAAGARVGPGDALATGSSVSIVHRIRGARHLGVAPSDLAQVTRVRVGQEVAKGAVLARTGRRLARAVVAPVDGRLEHVSTEGDFYVAPMLERWIVRSTIAGEVVRASGSRVRVEGEAWSLGGIAAYGPDAIGELSLVARGPDEELPPHRIDVRLRDRILVGGARIAAEAMTRAHACGVAGLVAGAVPAGGLRVVYGDDVAARGLATKEDRPTVLCLEGFGTGPLPDSVFGPLASLAGALGAIHVASARLFVFAPADALSATGPAPGLALAGDYGGVRPTDLNPSAVEDAIFPSEARAPAVRGPEGPLPAANLLPFDAAR